MYSLHDSHNVTGIDGRQFQKGLTTFQLVGVFGEWYISGSDTNWTVGSSLPANPDNDDIQFLQEVVDLSPSCNVGYCTEFDEDAFMAMTEVDEVLVHGYLGSIWGLDNEQFRNYVVEKTGKPPIFFEMSKEGSDMCELDPSGLDSTCPGISMIDLIEKNFELAEYFDFDIPDSINTITFFFPCPAFQPYTQVESRSILNIVMTQHSGFLKGLSSKGEVLLINKNSFLVFDHEHHINN